MRPKYYIFSSAIWLGIVATLILLIFGMGERIFLWIAQHWSHPGL
jgi:hypothetical protein